MNTKRRVVITGLGPVTSIGIGKEIFWPALISGKSGVSEVSFLDLSLYDRHFAGEIKNFDASLFLNKRKQLTLGRASQLAIAASKLALRDAHLDLQQLDLDRFSVCVGTTGGEIGVLESYNDFKKQGRAKEFNRSIMTVYPACSIGGNIARELKLSGYNHVFTTACASGNYAIGDAYDLIVNGKTDFALAGGADGYSRVIFTGFGRLFSIAPEKCQPFDKNRKGMIPGEASGILLLETLESAQKRKAHIYAEVIGYGLSCDAHHMTQPSVDGISRAVLKAIHNAGITSQDVDYVSAHGTGTRENDRTESQVYRNVFGERIKEVPISSIKSMLGHTMGAASAIEAIACCLTIDQQVIAPTINFEEKDPECDIDCVPNVARKAQVEVVLNNASAFGGNNCCLVLRKCK